LRRFGQVMFRRMAQGFALQAAKAMVNLPVHGRCQENTGLAQLGLSLCGSDLIVQMHERSLESRLWLHAGQNYLIRPGSLAQVERKFITLLEQNLYLTPVGINTVLGILFSDAERTHFGFVPAAVFE